MCSHFFGQVQIRHLAPTAPAVTVFIAISVLPLGSQGLGGGGRWVPRHAYPKPIPMTCRSFGTHTTDVQKFSNLPIGSGSHQPRSDPDVALGQNVSPCFPPTFRKILSILSTDTRGQTKTLPPAVRQQNLPQNSLTCTTILGSVEGDTPPLWGQVLAASLPPPPALFTTTKAQLIHERSEEGVARGCKANMTLLWDLCSLPWALQ